MDMVITRVKELWLLWQAVTSGSYEAKYTKFHPAALRLSTTTFTLLLIFHVFHNRFDVFPTSLPCSLPARRTLDGRDNELEKAWISAHYLAKQWLMFLFRMPALHTLPRMFEPFEYADENPVPNTPYQMFATFDSVISDSMLSVDRHQQCQHSRNH